MNETDLRVIKTNHIIENAMISLLQKKSFEKVTVQDILNTALVNRSTFYKHYDDKYALLRSIYRENIAVLYADIDRRFSCDEAEVGNIILHLYQSIYDHRSTFLVLLKINTSEVQFRSELSCYLKSRFLTHYKSAEPIAAKIDYLSTLYAELVLTSLEWCLQHESISELQTFLPIFQSMIRALEQTSATKDST